MWKLRTEEEIFKFVCFTNTTSFVIAKMYSEVPRKTPPPFYYVSYGKIQSFDDCITIPKFFCFF